MRYFNYQEFEDSATARRDGIDNSLTPVAQQMVTILVEMAARPATAGLGQTHRHQ